MRLKSEGGHLQKKGVVEVISSLKPDGSSVGYDIRKGVWVCIEAATDYIQRCFKEYQVVTDPGGQQHGALQEVAPDRSRARDLGRVDRTSAASRPACPVTSTPTSIATAKRDLKVGEVLDGEGGYTVFGKLFPAKKSLQLGSLPLGLAHRLKLEASGLQGPVADLGRRRARRSAAGIPRSPGNGSDVLPQQA